MFMINKDGAHRQHMYYYDLSMFMINKDGSFSTTYVLLWFSSELFSLSIPAESKRAEKMLEPANEGS